MKIDLVYTLRDNKELLKELKLKKTKLEENLTSDKKLNLDTFLFLMAVNKFNLVYINNHTYYQEDYSDEERKCVIKYDKKQDKYGILEVTDKKLKEEKKNRLHILNLSKPIKNIMSGYKVMDLKEICKTLKIDIMKTATK